MLALAYNDFEGVGYTNVRGDAAGRKYYNLYTEFEKCVILIYYRCLINYSALYTSRYCLSTT